MKSPSISQKKVNDWQNPHYMPPQITNGRPLTMHSSIELLSIRYFGISGYKSLLIMLMFHVRWITCLLVLGDLSYVWKAHLFC